VAQQTQYSETISDTIIRYLKNNLPQGYFKYFLYGDPLDIPASLLPCIAVEILKEELIQGPTGMDLIKDTVVIKLMYNKKQDFGKSADEVLGIRALENYAIGVDPSTSEYNTKSVASILRKNFTLGQLITNETMIVDFGVSRRPQVMTAECHITVAIERYRTVTGRA